MRRQACSLRGHIVRRALTRSRPEVRSSPQKSAKRTSQMDRLITQRLTSQCCSSREQHFTLQPLGYLAHLAGFLTRGMQQRCGTRIAIQGPKGDKDMSAIAQPIAVQLKARQRKAYENWAPTAKVSAGVLAGAATILITAFLAPHWKTWTQQDMTPAVVTAITTIVTFAIQYWVPDRRK